MRKIKLLIVVTMCLCTSAFARKVKFATDVSNNLTYTTMYLHLNSDGAGTNANPPAAGFYTADNYVYTADVPAYIQLTKETGSNIWSVVLDLPADKVYKYTFAYGHTGYEIEVIPDESAAICWGCGDQNYDNDTIANIGSRWVYVDSLARPSITSIAPASAVQGSTYSYTVNTSLKESTDTLFIGAILFGENAPSGKTLVRFKVDMRYQPVSAGGVHLAGNFQNWDLNALPMYSFNPLTNVSDDTKTYTSTVYERVVYLAPGTYEYKFYQGNTSESSEIVPSGCATNGNRTITVGSTAMILDTVCFSVCGHCSSVDKSSLTTVTSTPALFSNFTYSLTNAPSGMAVNKNVINWTPSTDVTTSGDVTLKVSNGLYSDTELFTIAVSEATAVTAVNSSDITIYPVPAKDVAVIDFGKIDNYNVSIVDLLGQEVRKYRNVSDSKLQVERGNLSTGIYYVVTSKDGVTIVRSKIIFE